MLLCLFRIQTECQMAPTIIQLTDENIHGMFLAQSISNGYKSFWIYMYQGKNVTG